MMNNPPDLRAIFNDWLYDEDDNVRFFTTEDGRDVMQIRQPMGIEQYELDGHPDGIRPRGFDSVLDYFLDKKKVLSREDDSLILTEVDFRRLREESVLYYLRYLALFQVGQYERVFRDTAHNLAVCRLVEECYEGSDSADLLQYKPYIRRLNAISRAMILLAEDDTGQAVQELEKAKKDIESGIPVSTPIFQFEKLRSIQHLVQVINQVQEANAPSETPKGFRDRIAEELSRAVEREDYEKAARLRDRLKRLDA